ncbi:hypothetical protein Tco_0567366 [Tanacetum coccineum]
MSHYSCSTAAEKMPSDSHVSELTSLRLDLFLLELVLSLQDFALVLLRFFSLSDLIRWDDVLLLDKLLWLLPEERALSFVQDVSEDSLDSHFDRPFVPELSEFSSLDSL